MQVPDFQVQGWCPGALRPMMSGDGLVLRIRPQRGRFTALQMRTIAVAARQHGNGILELTARANLQLRGIAADAHGRILDRLGEVDLLDADPAIEARRNIVLSPFCSADEGDLAAELAQMIAEGPDLPGKFGFAVDAGPQRWIAATSADIRIERGKEGLILRADGMAGGQVVPRENAVPEALRMARWFAETGGIHEARGRMSAHVRRVAVPFDTSAIPFDAAPQPHPGLVEDGSLIAFEFGILQAEVLAEIAELAPEVRMTPWRMFYAPKLDLRAVTGAIAGPDPRLNVFACTGAPACPQALQETRALARRLAFNGLKTLHISGCGKGCALARPADLVLTATREGFVLARNAKAGAEGQFLPLDEITEASIRKAM